MTVSKIKEKLAKTRFDGNEDLVGIIIKTLKAYGEAHLFDGGSDYNYRVSEDPNCEDKSYGEYWLVGSFYNDRIEMVELIPYWSQKRHERDISERPTVLGDLATVDCGL
jgi:hypothetical protein